MTSQSPRIYIYKITFEEVPYYYYGVHKEKKFDEYYMGSPVTHKWMWDFYTPKKQILQLFDVTDEGWIEAQKVETRLIRPFFNADKWCLNESCGGLFSLEVSSKAGKIGGKKTGKKNYELGLGIASITPEERSENGKKIGKKNYELGLGFHSLTKEQRSENGKRGGKIGGKKAKELGVGIHAFTPEQRRENSKKGGEKAKELGIGICGLSPEQRRENGKKLKELGIGIHGYTKEQKSDIGKIGGDKCRELDIGIFSLTKEELSEAGKRGGKIGGKISGKITSSQKWECTETGFIANPGNLTQYQRRMGIDTTKRIRIE